MNKGAQALNKVPVPAEKIAAACGVGRTTVYLWKRGGKPDDDNRARLFELYGITQHLWDEDEQPRTAEPPKPTSAEPVNVETEAAELMAIARSIRAEVQSDPNMLPADRIAALEKCARVMTAFGKFTGAALTVSVRQILASPHWREIGAAIETALTPWPDALEAVADALLALEAEDDPSA